MGRIELIFLLKLTLKCHHFLNKCDVRQAESYQIIGNNIITGWRNEQETGTVY